MTKTYWRRLTTWEGIRGRKVHIDVNQFGGFFLTPEYPSEDIEPRSQFAGISPEACIHYDVPEAVPDGCKQLLSDIAEQYTAWVIDGKANQSDDGIEGFALLSTEQADVLSFRDIIYPCGTGEDSCDTRRWTAYHMTEEYKLQDDDWIDTLRSYASVFIHPDLHPPILGTQQPVIP